MRQNDLTNSTADRCNMALGRVNTMCRFVEHECTKQTGIDHYSPLWADLVDAAGDDSRNMATLAERRKRGSRLFRSWHEITRERGARTAARG